MLVPRRTVCAWSRDARHRRPLALRPPAPQPGLLRLRAGGCVGIEFHAPHVPVTASARWRGPHRPAAAGERGPDAVELFGAALPPGPGEVLVVANFGILHMPASAGDPNKFEARTKHALRRLDKISRAAGLSVTVLLVAPPTLRGLRSPGLHPAQLEAFAPAMKRLATEGLGVSVRVLDLAPLSAARADATFDGLHYVREVPAAAVDAALGMLCEL